MKDKEVECTKCKKKIRTSDSETVCFQVGKKKTWFCKECGTEWISFLDKYDLIID